MVSRVHVQSECSIVLWTICLSSNLCFALELFVVSSNQIDVRDHCLLMSVLAAVVAIISSSLSCCPPASLGVLAIFATVSSRSRSTASASSLLPFLSVAMFGLEPRRRGMSAVDRKRDRLVCDKLRPLPPSRRLLKSAMVGTLFMPRSLLVKDLFLTVALRRKPVDPDVALPGGGSKA